MSLNSHTIPSVCLPPPPQIARATETLINQKFIRTQEKQLTFLILTFEEGIPFVVANFGFDQLHENIVPPLTLLLTCALYESWSIGRLYEDRVDMAGDLFSISHLDDVRHVDAGLWYRLGLIATEKKDTKKCPV
jgi:hypothetical protein